MAALDNTKKSARLLASRRYTHDTYTDSQEAFTSTLDINANEVYVDQSFIPSSGLPFSGSGQNGSTYSVDGQGIIKYWYRQPLTKSDLNNEAWFFLSPSGSNSGIGAQIIDANQKTNFISPKYAVPALANANTEDATPGYGVKVFVSSNATTPSAGDQISVNNYSFDYKTGVLQFVSSGVAPTAGQYVYITVNQYVGRLLSNNISNVSSSIAALSASLGGSGAGGSIGDRVTNLEIVSASVNSFTSSASGRLTNLESTSASVNVSISNINSTTSSFSALVNGIASKTGSYATTGSNVFNGNQVISGSTYITGDLVVYGSSSVQNLSQSVLNIGTNIITVNTLSPQARFGGISVIDSGSNPLVSGSLFYDSVDDEWIFVHRGVSGAPITSSVVITGPETYDSLGNETRLTTNRVPKTTDSFHIVDSNITDSGTFVSINSNTQITGSLVVSNGITGQINANNGIVSGSSQIDVTSTTNFASFSGSISASLQALSASVGSGAGVSISNLNAFSASQITKDSTLATYTASVASQLSGIGTATASFESKFTTLATLTGSNATRLTNLETTSASVNTSISSINLVTASLNSKTGSYATTGSNVFVETQTITGSLNIKDSAATFSIAGNGFSETYLSSNGGLVLQAGGSGVQIKSNNLEVQGTISGTTISGSSITGLGNATQFSTSVDSRLSNLQSTSASVNTSVAALNTSSASQQISINALNTVSGSNLGRLTNLETTSASVNTSITALNTSSASQQISIDALNVVSGSNLGRLTNLESTSASVNISIAALNTYTGSNTSTTALNSFTASAISKFADIATITGSLLAASSSQGSRITVLEGTGTKQGVGTTNDVTFNSVITTANVIVGGDLVVQGNTVTLNTSQLVVEDKLISLASGSTNAATANGAGIEVLGASANITYQSTPDAWQFNKPITGSAVTASLNVPSGGGNSKRIAFRGTTDNIEFVAAPSTAGELLQYDGTNFVMSNTIDGGSF